MVETSTLDSGETELGRCATSGARQRFTPAKVLPGLTLSSVCHPSFSPSEQEADGEKDPPPMRRKHKDMEAGQSWRQRESSARGWQ